MQLFILDKSPYIAPYKIPAIIDKRFYAQKMLIELGQLMSSVLGGKEYDERLYKKKHQGKEFQSFIKENPIWTWVYYCQLALHCMESYNWTENENNTMINYNNIQYLWWDYFELEGKENKIEKIKSAPFRYNEKYVCNIPTDSILDINTCVDEYNKYMGWKINK